MSRAVSVHQVLNKKRKLLEFNGKYEKSFGRPELKGSWLIYGGSGAGKTTFLLQMAKYLTQFDRVAYNSLEEGDSESIRLAFLRVNMKEVARKFILLDQEPIEEMKERLRKRKSPKIIIVDSVQYTQMKLRDYIDLKAEFQNHLFIWNSHERAKRPDGQLASKIEYDAHIKIRVEGYVAFPVSRFGGGEPFTIWEEGANQFHGI